MADKKNQHYVPQFYQRNFSDDGKTVGTYLLKQKKYIPKSSIKNQASEDYFYSKDNKKIEDALGDIEAMADAVIKDIARNPKGKISKQDGYTLYVFTMLQLGRTLYRTNELEEFSTAMFRQLIKSIVHAKRNNGIVDEETSLLSDNLIDNFGIELNNPGGAAL